MDKHLFCIDSSLMTGTEVALPVKVPSSSLWLKHARVHVELLGGKELRNPSASIKKKNKNKKWRHMKCGARWWGEAKQMSLSDSAPAARERHICPLRRLVAVPAGEHQIWKARKKVNGGGGGKNRGRGEWMRRSHVFIPVKHHKMCAYCTLHALQMRLIPTHLKVKAVICL